MKKTDQLFKKIFRWIEEKDIRQVLLREQVKKDFRVLYYGKEREHREEFYVKKIRLFFCFILAAVFFTAIFAVSLFFPDALEDGNKLRRNEYGKGSSTYLLGYKADGEKRYLEVKVNDKKYNKKEIEKRYQEVLPELEKTFLGENRTADHVDKNLNCVKKIKDFPFYIKWESNDYNLVQPDGELVQKNLTEEGNLTYITAILQYEEFEAEYQIPIRVFCRVKTPEEKMEEKMTEQIYKNDKADREEEFLVLPDVMDGKTISWSEKKETTMLLFSLLVLASGGMIFFLQDYDLHKKILFREKQMKQDYADIVSLLTVYMSAGMTCRRAWEKIAVKYEKSKGKGNHFVYEEMLVTMHEMQGGISEYMAYERFGSRCQLQEYTKFSALLIQNLRKGSISLTKSLQNEAQKAFEDKKLDARRMGEEVSTKLLLPMTMQLGMVMMIILMPVLWNL